MSPEIARGGRPINVDDVRAIVADLPRSYEVLVRDQIKFRVGSIVYLAFSRDETELGVAFPKEERDALVSSAPDRFLLPRPSEMRWNWVVVRLDAIELDELRELVLDAWRMVVPKRLAATLDEPPAERAERRARPPGGT